MVDFYTPYFHQDNPSLYNEAIDKDSFYIVSDQELADLFTTEAVEKSINTYPGARSCGLDAIYIKILKSLQGISFYEQFASFCQFCYLVGLTSS